MWYKVSMLNNRHTTLLGASIVLSLVVHLTLYSLYANIGPLDLVMPVQALALTTVDLKDPPAEEEPDSESDTVQPEEPPGEPEQAAHAPRRGQHTEAAAAPVVLQKDPEPTPPAAVTVAAAVKAIPTPQVVRTPDPPFDEARQPVPAKAPAPVEEKKKCPRGAMPPAAVEQISRFRQYLGSIHEKLVYRISLLGLPVGTAELEAHGEKRETRITLRVTSDPLFSALYPVDDFLEIQHINSNLVTCQFRQREGSLQGSSGFTISHKEQSVFWLERGTNATRRYPLPNAEVLDLLSGLYNLRTRPLEVGTPETLHIFDNGAYAAVPVEVAGRETVNLPGLRQFDALLVLPKLTTDGFFKRTGEIRIWLSDDEHKTPVKVVTTIALGQVTAELMSSESKPPERSVLPRQAAPVGPAGTH